MRITDTDNIKRSLTICGVSLLSLLLYLFCSAYISAQEPSEAEVWLERLEEAPKKISYAGKRMVVTWLQDTTISSEERVVHQAGGVHRVQPDSPPKGGARRRPMFGYPDQPRIDRSLLMQNYRVEVSPGDMIAGRPTRLLRITPRRKGRPARNLWLDQERGIVLRLEHYDTEGILRSIFVFSRITYDSARVQQMLDKLPPPRSSRPERPGQPPRWNHAEQPEALKDILKRPLVLLDPPPEGFILRGVQWMRVREQIHVQLRYTDGLASLSFFQGEKHSRVWKRPPALPPHVRAEELRIANHKIQMIDNGLIRLLRWSQRGQRFTLISELSRSATIQLVAVLLNGKK